jgi:hypothetical protein
MAETSDHRSAPRNRTWIAFVAGAVAMLAIVLVWLALTRAQEASGSLRADIALPRPPLPSLPTTPPPEGPHLPRVPVPNPS